MQRLIPYDAEIYASLLTRYNEATAAAQLIALIAGMLIVACARRGGVLNGRLAFAAVAGFWLWTGIVFHYQYFSTLNWAAWVFAALFVAQGVAVAIWGTLLGKGPVLLYLSKGGVAAMGVLILAVTLHPLLTVILGEPLGGVQVFGMTPLPTVLATLGTLMLVDGRVPRWLLGFPLLWSLWELAGAITLDRYADAGTAIVATLVAIWLLAARKSTTHSKSDGR